MMPHRHAGQPLSRAQLITQRAFATVERFMHIQASSGIVLLVTAAIALIWANSPFASSYHHLWHIPLSIGLGDLTLDRKSTRLNSSHVRISYAVFCLKKKNNI